MNSLNIKDYKSLNEILSSSVEEDVNIGLENLKNLNLDPVYTLLLAKDSNKSTREKIIESHSDVFSNDGFDIFKQEIPSMYRSNSIITNLSWQNFYNFINTHRKDDDNVKTLFEYLFDKEIKGTIEEVTDYKFNYDVNMKLKW
jgi:hypothetical protein